MITTRTGNRNNAILNESVEQLSKFYGIYTPYHLAEEIARREILGETRPVASITEDTSTVRQEQRILALIIKLLIDTSKGALTTSRLIKKINQHLTSLQPNYVREFNRFVQIYYGNTPETTIYGSQLEANNRRNADISIRGILSLDNTNKTNSNLNNPDRFTSPCLSVIFQNHVRAMLTNKNVNACTLFLNTVPSIEMARATVYCDIQFQFKRSPLSDQNRIQIPSLERYLFGALSVPNNEDNVLRIFVNSKVENNNSSSKVGMELFTMPITLTNANEIDDQQRRSVPILDKFRPLLAFKNLNIEVVPTTGIMSYKSAQLSISLLDRSRLAEIADFIRPDLYSNTEILIEYGWIHPDKPESKNHYANLINSMRCREKYGIVNSSFQLDESGQVNIELKLVMRGAAEMDLINIAAGESSDGSQNGNTIGSAMQEMRNLANTIANYRNMIFGSNVRGAPEVRGIQILDAATDENGRLFLDQASRENLNNFRNSLRNASRGHNVAASQLLASLKRLYGNDGNGGIIREIRNRIRNNIVAKMEKLKNGNDPFINPAHIRHRGRRILASQPYDALLVEERSLREKNIPETVSLAKLLLIFVGEPLASSGKFDDIQFIFYPFNQYAAFASRINIGQFLVDTRYFLRQYSQYRFESASRAMNVSLKDFLTFIAQTIIDDPAAPSYGLMDSSGAFYREVRENDRINLTTAPNIPDAAALQLRIQRLLRDVTPDGSFKMPQIDFYIECLPESEEFLEEGENNSEVLQKSILRIHVFDRQTTNYETQTALLQAARDDELRTIGNISINSDTPVGASQAAEANRILQKAQEFGLVEFITDSAGKRDCIIRGGTRKLKEFLMKTSPYIIFGNINSAIKSSGLSTIQDSALSTVNILRSFNARPFEPNGENPGGLPLRVIPSEMSMEMWGCPLIDFAQQYFVDFQTGTTLDNYYAVTGISHRIESGGFTTSVKLISLDAYGKYESMLDKIRSAINILENAQQRNQTMERRENHRRPIPRNRRPRPRRR